VCAIPNHDSCREGGVHVFLWLSCGKLGVDGWAEMSSLTEFRAMGVDEWSRER